MTSPSVWRAVTLVSVLTLWTHSSVAVELEDFAGGVSNTRVTSNPASVGLIDRLHLQYNWTSYQSGNVLPAFLDRGKVFGQDADPFVVSSDNDTAPLVELAEQVESIEYSRGRVAGFTTTFVLPFDFASFGASVTFQHERYENGRYLDFEDNRISTDREGPEAEEINTGSLAFLVGVPFQQFTVGAKLTRQTIVHSVVDLDPSFFAATDNLTLTTDLLNAFKISGNTTYNIPEYGISIPNLFNFFDIGVVYRPKVTGVMRLDLDSAALGLTFDDFEFEDPQMLLLGVGYTLELGNSGLQFLGDTGSIGASDNTALGGPATGGSINGGLIRYALPPYIDISYGSQTRQFFTFRMQTETIGVQFPFLEGFNLKFGLQTLRIFDEDDKALVSVTYGKFSFNLQFGDAARRALIVPPKTKRIRFIDRL